MRLDLYTHNFAVTEITAFDLPKIYGFLLPLVQKGLVKTRGRFKQVPLRTFVARFANRSVFRFHINQYFDFMEHMRQQGYQDHEFKVNDHRDTKFTAAKVKFITKNLPEPYERQVPIINYVLEPGISKMVTLQTGKGKALCNRTVLLTDHGWQPMGAIQVGWRVMCPNGTWTTVKGVYPQPGLSKMYRLTWEDGRVSVACKDHQWTIQRGLDNIVVTTEELIDYLANGPVTIPPTIPLESGTQWTGPVPIWLYAVLLSRSFVEILSEHDSHRTGRKSRIEIFLQPTLMPEFLELLSTAGYTTAPSESGRVILLKDGEFPQQLVDDLRKHYGVFNMNAIRAWVLPPDMDRLPIAQRLQFLRFTLGTQPYVKSPHTGTTYTYSRQGEIATLETIQKMIWSIGGVCTRVHDSLYYRYPIAQSSIHKGWPEQPAYITGIGLHAITPIEDRPATCIQVNDPSAMFVTADYITTHNTMIAMTCAQRLGFRTIVIVKGGFTDKWHEDLDNAFEFEEGELLLVKGSGGLHKLLQDAIHKRPKMNPSVIIVTTRTLANYFKLYELSNGKDKKILVPPHEILPKLKIGFRIMDEVHLEFHFMYRMDLYSHVLKSLSLSATLVSRDEFINKVHEIAYPSTTRNDGGGYHAYSHATCYMYRIRFPDTVKCMGAQGYSHHMLEEWILANEGRKKIYLTMIRRVLKEYFIDIRKDNHSYLIFASSVDMCDAIKEDIELHYGTFEVGRYCGSMGDDYTECFLEPDIVISTLGSAGAAVDKPGLLGTLLTIAVDSIQSVLQLMGRTRELKGTPGMDPSLVYFSCKDIESHEKYRKNKVELFKGRVLSHRMVDSTTTL